MEGISPISRYRARLTKKCACCSWSSGIVRNGVGTRTRDREYVQHLCLHPMLAQPKTLQRTSTSDTNQHQQSSKTSKHGVLASYTHASRVQFKGRHVQVQPTHAPLVLLPNVREEHDPYTPRMWAAGPVRWAMPRASLCAKRHRTCPCPSAAGQASAPNDTRLDVKNHGRLTEFVNH